MKFLKVFSPIISLILGLQILFKYINSEPLTESSILFFSVIFLLKGIKEGLELYVESKTKELE